MQKHKKVNTQKLHKLYKRIINKKNTQKPKNIAAVRELGVMSTRGTYNAIDWSTGYFSSGNTIFRHCSCAKL